MVEKKKGALTLARKRVPQLIEEEVIQIARSRLAEWQKMGMDTEVSMFCRNCGNDVDIIGFLVHASTAILVSLWGLMDKKLLTQLLSEAFGGVLNWFMPTKSVIDTSMAQLANDFKMKCPKCKKFDSWKEGSAFYAITTVAEERKKNELNQSQNDA